MLSVIALFHAQHGVPCPADPAGHCSEGERCCGKQCSFGGGGCCGGWACSHYATCCGEQCCPFLCKDGVCHPPSAPEGLAKAGHRSQDCMHPGSPCCANEGCAAACMHDGACACGGIFGGCFSCSECCGGQYDAVNFTCTGVTLGHDR